MSRVITTINAGSRNKRSVVQASASLTDYMAGRSDREAIIDLLTDLRHYCAHIGVDFESASVRSLHHYTTETRGET